jgi:hypothetical protein
MYHLLCFQGGYEQRMSRLGILQLDVHKNSLEQAQMQT